MRRGSRAALAVAAAVAAALVAVPVAGAIRADDSTAARPGTAGDTPPAELTAERMRDSGIADIPVEFTVENDNRSDAACNSDGGTYRVSGHLTAPARALGEGGAVTLYLHGLASGEWYWRLNVPGYHHAEEMAERGHASLTIDRLGYGDSDRPPGMATCLGSQADIAHQIAEQLASGGYTATGPSTGAEAETESTAAEDGSGAPTPSFDRVALAGHGNGAEIAQIAAYSFGGTDGLAVMGWSGPGLTDRYNSRFFSALAACMQGGVPAGGDSGPGGYTYFDTGPDEFADGNFHNAEQAVTEAAVPRQSRHPCGEMAAQLEASVNGVRHYDEITDPVFFAYGEEDERVQGGGSHRALFTGTDDTELLMLSGSGHYLGLDRGAARLHDRMAAWLDREGLA